MQVRYILVKSLKEALLIGSTDIMLAHNHPSGVLTPSTQDLVVTGKLMECGKLMGVRVLDHLIVSQTSFLSFAREELLKLAWKLTNVHMESQLNT